MNSIMINSLSNGQNLVPRIYADSELRKKIMITAATSYYKFVSSDVLPPITPGRPHENRLLFKKVLRSCRGFINWIDLFIGIEGLEFLLDSFDDYNIRGIKILTSLYNNEQQITEELRIKFEQLKNELNGRGISLEMRLVSTKRLYERVAHDRFIIAENVRYNIPSFTTIIKGRFSEIKKTTNDVPFQDYWDDEDCLDIIKDWPRIKQFLSNIRVYFDAICSDCGISTKVPFKPDSRRPVYCSSCKLKH